MFDLVYTDATHKDLGVVQAYSLDAAWGSDENDFELLLPATASLDFGALVYVDGTQIGGVVDDKSPDGTGEVSTVTYHGRTWHGILAYSVIQPDSGKDYYTYSGDANDVIRAIITRQGLQDIFECTGNSGITVSGRFDRYTDVYGGLLKMLTRDSNKRGKLNIEKQPGGKVSLQAVEVGRYTSELDSDRYGFKSTLDMRPVNHLICLGEGDLKERDVVHFYADVNGNVSQTQTQFGINERAMTYDANNSDHDELLKSGREKLEDLQKTSSIDMTLADDTGTFEVGDVVGALDNLTGVYVESIVSKVIVSVGDNGLATYQYEVGDIKTSQSASGGGVSMTTLEDGYVKKTGLRSLGGYVRLYGTATTSAEEMTLTTTYTNPLAGKCASHRVQGAGGYYCGTVDTAAGCVTVSDAGNYLIIAKVYWYRSFTAGDACQLSVLVNGSAASGAYKQTHARAANPYDHDIVAIAADLAAGSKVEIGVANATAARGTAHRTNTTNLTVIKL